MKLEYLGFIPITICLFYFVGAMIDKGEDHIAWWCPSSFWSIMWQGFIATLGFCIVFVGLIVGISALK